MKLYLKFHMILPFFALQQMYQDPVRCNCRIKTSQQILGRNSRSSVMNMEKLSPRTTRTLAEQNLLKWTFFLRSTCRHEIRNDTNLSCQNNRGKVRKTVKFVHLWQGKGMKFTQIYQNPTNCWPIGIKQSCPSKFCTFRLKSKY